MADDGPHNPLSALQAAMDEVPLTAEQRRKLQDEFALHMGASVPISVPVPAQPAAMQMPAPPVMIAPSPGKFQIALPAALPPSYGELVTGQRPPDPPLVAPPVFASPPAPAKPLITGPLPPSYSELMGTSSAPSGGSAGPIAAQSVQDIIQSTVKDQVRRSQMKFFSGLLASAVTGLIIGAIYAGPFLLLAPVKGPFIPLALATVADGVLLFAGLFSLGSLHEWMWHARRHWGIIATLWRGILSPLTIPLGTMLLIHEFLWGKQERWSQRMLRALAAPVTIPIGAAWDLSGLAINLVRHRKLSV